MTSIRKITAALESWAPPASKLDYDNVGLQVGDASREVDRVLVALDLTPAVIEDAEKTGAGLIVTHHPLLFRPLKRVASDDPPGALALRLAEARIAYYAIHTNLDAAPGGVSFALAEQIGLRDIRFLQPLEGKLVKLATFVPAGHAAGVRQALAAAGAGRIGDYEECAFELAGTGHFRPGEGASPFIGSAGGGHEAVNEIRIEVEVPRWDLGRVLRALREAHPYEEVAYDVFPVEQPASRFGMGAIGSLEAPEPMARFLERVASRLDSASLRYAGRRDAMIGRVAVCGGSGGSLIRDAARAGADAFVTADLTYHRFFETMDASGEPGMALVDAGHYETEAVTEDLLISYLRDRFPDVAFERTRHRTSPMQTFAR
jgi:dinuclear metal center YbgI/SA1388 family protein